MVLKRECRFLVFLPLFKPQEGISFAKKNLRSLSLLGLASSCQRVKRGHAPCLDDGFTAGADQEVANTNTNTKKYNYKCKYKD